MKWVGHEAWVTTPRNVYKILVAKPEGRESLGRRGRKWKNSIKLDIRKIGSDVVDRIHLHQVRECCVAFVSTAMNLLVP